MKLYSVRPSAPEHVRRNLDQHPEVVQDLLFARGIEDATQAAAFLDPDFVRDSHDPFLMPGMEAAVGRIIAAHRAGEHVAVWSDYDADGIPGGVALASFLREIGMRVSHYIPHRHHEGFGLNERGIDTLADAGVSLVITVDLGTSDVAPVAHARSRGVDVIITDHHLPPSVLPDAVAIVNPKLNGSEYPFDGLCGAGVAWKLIQGILARERFGYAEGREKWLLDLIAIGTLADRVPLVGENRALARFGLIVMRKARRPGLAALFDLLRMRPGGLTEDDVGFMIAPRINAASRMDNPGLAARLLAVADQADAYALARELEALNTERKTLVATITKEAHRRLKELESLPQVIVLGSPSWRPGVLGLVATTLVEEHGAPVFLWGREGGEVLRGSCRSNGDVNVVALMQASSAVFEDHGGHHASGGFSLLPDRVHELAPTLIAALGGMERTESVSREVAVDRALPLADALLAHHALTPLAPFGEGNPKPLFLFPRVLVVRSRTFGKQKNHLELTLVRDSTRVTSIAFFSHKDSFQKPIVDGMEADIVGHLETDWRGETRIRIVDII